MKHPPFDLYFYPFRLTIHWRLVPDIADILRFLRQDLRNMPTFSFDIRFASRSGGCTVYTAQLIRAMVREYPDVRWRLYANTGSGPQEDLIRRIREENGISPEEERMQAVPCRTGALGLGQHVEFLRFRDDAALYHYPHFDAPLGMRGIPLVMTIHDLYPMTIAGDCSGTKREYIYRAARHNARRAAAVITISQYSRGEILEHLKISEGKITVIPQGYAPEFRPIEDLDVLEEVRRRYALPPRFLYYTGNQKPHKNLPRFLQAYATLPEATRKEFGIVISGPGTEESRKQLVEQAESLGILPQVRILGLLPEGDLPAMYNLASLFVLPSLYEGFGMPLLEAMACGTPVACSNATAIPEVVGTAGRLFNPEDVDSMAGALQAAIEQDVGQPAVRETVLRHARVFSWSITARKTAELYRQLF